MANVPHSPFYRYDPVTAKWRDTARYQSVGGTIENNRPIASRRRRPRRKLSAFQIAFGVAEATRVSLLYDAVTLLNQIAEPVFRFTLQTNRILLPNASLKLALIWCQRMDRTGRAQIVWATEDVNPKPQPFRHVHGFVTLGPFDPGRFEAKGTKVWNKVCPDGSFVFGGLKEVKEDGEWVTMEPDKKPVELFGDWAKYSFPWNPQISPEGVIRLNRLHTVV